MQPSTVPLRTLSVTNGKGISLSDVVPLLKKARSDGKGGYTALCPAHDDHNPSLSIRAGDKQGVIVTCHSRGCSYPDIMRGFGLDTHSARSDEPATHYEYTDENGVALYRVARKGMGAGKSFYQEKSDGRGGWIPSVQGVRRVPFGLPELIEAIAEDRRIYIVEGEKDCLTAREYGLPATCNAGGAGKWGDDHSAHLKDADVVIIPDNDAPGRDHAEKVAKSLTGIARSIRVVNLPGLQEKGDLTDWFSEGRSLEELERLVDATAEWLPGIADGELPPSTCALYAPPPEPLSYVVDEMFIAGEPGMIFGDGGSFKTTVALHVACAVAGGYKSFGHFGTTQRPVLVVSAEDGSGVLTQRMRAMCKGHGWDVRRVLGNVHYYCLGGVALTDPRWCEKIRAEINRLDAGLVILDPYQELVPGINQDSAQETGPHMTTLRSFCQPTGAATILLHHAGKAGREKRTIDRVRGSSALYSAMRLVYLVTDSPADGTIKVECIKNNRAEKLKPFAIRRIIDADPANRLHWLSARFDHITIRQAEFDQAQTFILDAIDTHGRQSTTDLKKAAKGSGVSAIAVSGAIKTLDVLGVIDFEEGDKGAKLWGRKESVVLAEQPRQPEEQHEISLPSNLDACPATSPNAPVRLPTPLGGQPAGNVTSLLAGHNAERHRAETSEAA